MAESDDAGKRQEYIWRGVESLRQLADARKSGCQYSKMVEAFEEANGDIRNSYFTASGRGCVVTTHVDKFMRWRDQRQVLLWHDYRAVSSQVKAFDEMLGRAIWIARETERGTDRLLPRRNRMVIANLLFTVLVLLLGTLDVVAVATKDTSIGDPERKRLNVAAGWARERLDSVEEYVEKAGLQTAVRYYLTGLPLGLAVIAALILIFRNPNGAIDVDPNFLLVTAAAGGLGSITSVMIRITRGQKLSIDPRQGPIVTTASGAFRALIGAVFGVAFYVLVQGGLLPLDDSSGDRLMFYAGLAFLAGFSERWAQDTVVRSAPISPSPVVSADGVSGVTHVDKDAADDDF